MALSGSPLGLKRSEESKIKMSKAQKGRPYSKHKDNKLNNGHMYDLINGKRKQEQGFTYKGRDTIGTHGRYN